MYGHFLCKDGRRDYNMPKQQCKERSGGRIVWRCYQAIAQGNWTFRREHDLFGETTGKQVLRIENGMSRIGQLHFANVSV